MGCLGGWEAGMVRICIEVAEMLDSDTSFYSTAFQFDSHLTLLRSPPARSLLSAILIWQVVCSCAPFGCVVFV